MTMNNEQILEGNKLIAKYVGYIDNGCSEDGFLIHPETNFDEEIFSFQYNTSWDWLMPVVQKCKEDQLFGGQRLIDAIDKFLLTLSIEAVYNAVVDFITWYNLQVIK